MNLGGVALPLSSLPRAVQRLLDEWEERGRMEDSVVQSDNMVSSVTLTTTVRASNVLIMNLARKLGEACSLFLALVLCCSGVLLWSFTVDLNDTRRKYNMQISSSPGIGASSPSNKVAPAVTLHSAKAVTDNVLTEGKTIREYSWRLVL